MYKFLLLIVTVLILASTSCIWTEIDADIDIDIEVMGDDALEKTRDLVFNEFDDAGIDIDYEYKR